VNIDLLDVNRDGHGLDIKDKALVDTWAFLLQEQAME